MPIISQIHFQILFGQFLWSTSIWQKQFHSSTFPFFWSFWVRKNCLAMFNLLRRVSSTTPRLVGSSLRLPTGSSLPPVPSVPAATQLWGSPLGAVRFKQVKVQSALFHNRKHLDKNLVAQMHCFSWRGYILARLYSTSLKNKTAFESETHMQSRTSSPGKVVLQFLFPCLVKPRIFFSDTSCWAYHIYNYRSPNITQGKKHFAVSWWSGKFPF